MAKMAKEGYLRAAIEETQQLVQKPRAELWEEKKRRFQLPRYKMVKAAIDRYSAISHKNLTASCLPRQPGTARNLQTCWRCKGAGSPPPGLVAPPLCTPPPLITQPTPPGNTDRIKRYEIEGMPSRCVYIHSPLPNTQISIKMHLTRIARVIMILFQICWVYFLQCGNTADIDFEDKSSLLSESESQDKHWLKGTVFLSIIIICNQRTL
jgi:hypothetical protein